MGRRALFGNQAGTRKGSLKRFAWVASERDGVLFQGSYEASKRFYLKRKRPGDDLHLYYTYSAEERDSIIAEERNNHAGLGLPSFSSRLGDSLQREVSAQEDRAIEEARAELRRRIESRRRRDKDRDRNAS